MRWRATLALGAVLGVVLVATRLVDGPLFRSARSPVRVAPDVLFPGPPDDLVRVGASSSASGGRTVSVHRTEAGWRRSDGSSISGPEFDYLLQRLAPLLSARTLPGVDRGPYGLNSSDVSFELEGGGGRKVTVAVGQPDLEGNLRYAAVAGRDAVDLISARLVEDLLALVAAGPAGALRGPAEERRR